MRAAPLEDYDDRARGFWSRIKERFGWGGFEEDDEMEFGEEMSRKQAATLRVHSSKINHVSVWLTVQSFDSAQQAADGLKEGHQQIVNLEKAPPDVCTRIIDFLNGVIYALDGYVEKVGEKVYLFTPSNYVIEVENGINGTRKVQSPFNDN